MVWSRFLIKTLALNKKFTLISILFIIQTGLMQNTFFIGVNDALFSVFISFGFIYLYRGITDIEKSTCFFILSGLFFSCAICVRDLFILYLPGIFIIFLITIVKKKGNIKAVVFWFMTFILLAGLIHYPSLIKNKALSVLDKNPKGINATWSERNYLQVLQGRHLRPSWDEVLTYKKNHGENSLPNGFCSAIFKNPSLTLKNFARQFYLSQLSFIRKLGAFYLFFLGYILILFFKKLMFKDSFYWIPVMFYFSFATLLCILIIPNLEFRWFVSFPFIIAVFSIMEVTKLLAKHEKYESLFYLNIIIIAIFNTFLIGIW